MMAQAIAQRLQSEKATISRIRKTFGAASISCGVLHKGEIVFLHSEGYADVEQQKPATPDTIYSIASCSKGFVTALCNVLVHDHQLSWSTPISNYLPTFQTVHDPEVGRRATLLDLCSHGTGLAPVDHVGCGFYDQFFNKGSDQVHIASNLPVAYDFRSRWLYNNFLLGVVGDVIASVCGASAGAVLQEKIFNPLGMERTFTKSEDYASDGNVAIGYSVLDDGSYIPHASPELEDEGLQGASGFIRSTVKDMLVWAKSVMLAEGDAPADDEARLHAKKTLCDIGITRCARRPITFEGGLNENSYGLGWFRHQLPSRWLSSIGPNFALLQEPPVIARGQGGRQTICHYGSYGAFLTSFYTFPDTDSAVIVLANSSASRGDPTDLIAQSLIQALFDMEPKVQLDEYAAEAARTSKMIWPALVEEWVSSRVQGTLSPPLHDFLGTYVNAGFLLQVEIFSLGSDEYVARTESRSTPELLGFKVNSLEKQVGRLRHYHYDVWTFLPDSRDDCVRKGMEDFMLLPMLLLSFIRNAEGVVNALDWDLQAGVCEGPAPGLDRAVAPIRFIRT